MEKYYLQTIGLPIVDQQGSPLARVTDIVVNTDTGIIVGFSVSKRKVISPIDILAWNNNLRIHDAQDIVVSEDIHNYIVAVEKGVPIYRNRVFSKDGDFLGRVIDYGIDNKFFKLTCIVVAKSFLNFIFWDKKIISAKDIIEIQRTKITVKNLVRPVKMKKLKVRMVTKY